MNRQTWAIARNLFATVFLVAAFTLIDVRWTASPTGSPEAPGSSWGTNLDAALSESKTTHKLVMADFNATWCGPCQEYNQGLFTTQEFRNEAKNFILVDIDVDKHEDLAAKYGVDGIPDIRFFDSNGAELKHVVGYEGDQLISDMEEALATSKTSHQLG